MECFNWRCRRQTDSQTEDIWKQTALHVIDSLQVIFNALSRLCCKPSYLIWAHRNLSNGIYSPNVGSLYPIQMNLGSFLEKKPPPPPLVLSETCPPGNLSTQEHVYLGTCPRGTCLPAFLVVFGTVLIQTYIHSEVAPGPGTLGPRTLSPWHFKSLAP